MDDDDDDDDDKALGTYAPLECSQLDWTAADWTGRRKMDWTGVEWTGVDWKGRSNMDWTRLDWTGVDWTGVHWTGMDDNVWMHPTAFFLYGPLDVDPSRRRGISGLPRVAKGA